MSLKLIFCWPLFFGDRSFYLLQGEDTQMPGQYFSGNIPIVSDPAISLGILVGIILLCLLGIVYQQLKRLSRKHGWSRGRSILSALLVPVLFFVSWELVLHLETFKTKGDFVPDPQTFWSANPVSSKHSSNPENTLSRKDLGRITRIFDRSYTVVKPKNTFRIIFMGDSQSISLGQDRFSLISYPKVFEAKAHVCGLSDASHRRLQVINAGMSGFSSHQGLFLLKRDILNYSPDVLVEAFGYHDGNDATCTDVEVITDNPLVWEIRKWLYSSKVCLLLRTAILRNQAAIVDRLDQTKVVKRVPVEHYKRNLEKLYQLSQQHHFRLVLFIQPLRDQNYDENAIESRVQYAAAAQEIAQKHNLPVINARQHFAERSESLDSMFDDAIHFNIPGHAKVGQFVLDELLRQKIIFPGADTQQFVPNPALRPQPLDSVQKN